MVSGEGVIEDGALEAQPNASRRLALGTAIMALSNGGKLVLQLLLMPIIARLLGPSSYGVYSLAMPSVTFVLMLADGGLGQSMAREDESHDKVWSSAFWLLLGTGSALALGLALWSIPLGVLTHQPLLPHVMAPLSITIILLGFCVLPDARLIRRSRLEVYALVDLGTNIIAAIAALIAAYMHAGVWSLVIQMLCLWGVRAIALNIIAFRLPTFEFDWKLIAPHTKVGGGIVLTKFVDSMGRLLEVGIISRRFAVSAVGAYGFSGQAAWSLVQSVTAPIWMALYVRSIQQNEQEDTETLYNRLVRLIFVLTVPGSLIICATAAVIVPLFLGQSWRPSILLIALVFPSQALGSCGTLAGAALYARGKTKAQTAVAFAYSAIRVVAVSLPFGGWTMLAVYIAAANVAYFLIGVTNAKLSLGWSFRNTLLALRWPALAAIAAGVAAHFAIINLPPTFISLVLAGLAGLGAFVVVFGVLDLRQIKGDFELVRSLARKKTPA